MALALFFGFEQVIRFIHMLTILMLVIVDPSIGGWVVC
jgi:hypothetical protein